MARAKAILQSQFPYTISARCINKEWFNIPQEHVWKIFCDNLTLVHDEYGLKIHSFVMMSNHFHLLASTPNANISQCMLHFMTKSSKALTKAGNRINETFAGRHYKCILNEYNYFLNAYKYNYRNPVTAEICERVEDYQFSTLSMKLGVTEKRIPYCEDTLLLEDRDGILRWLNQKPDREKIEAARAGFKRQIFISRNKRNIFKPLLGPQDLL
jgi:REP element-mobilizing transposase RayT